MQLRQVSRCGVLKQRSGTVCGIVLVSALAAFVVVPESGGAWFSSHNSASHSAPAGSRNGNSAPPASQPKVEPQKGARIATPQELRLKTQTAELAALARQLKSDVDKTNKDILSVNVIRKAGEIEKYAHYLRGTAADGTPVK
jgi:hypothetical protein